jgi:hypothetical protein
MPEESEPKQPSERRRRDRGDGPPRNPAGKGPAPKPGGKKRGGLRLRPIGGSDFELDHPRCVAEMELDYEEGIALWREGDIEAARDALRFALQGCGDNLWVHNALGRIALGEFHDPTLARGHFGYAFELAQRALPAGFTGRLPRPRGANRPFYEAIEGLIECYEALGKPNEAAGLRELVRRLTDGGRARGPEPPRGGPGRRP